MDALGRAHYVRYDESTATALGENAQRVLDDYSGDLRGLRADADGDVDAIRAALKSFRRIGDVGTHIFCREVQLVWPEVRPHFDRALDTAGSIGLPTDRKKMADLVAPEDVSRLAAALVRRGLEK